MSGPGDDDLFSKLAPRPKASGGVQRTFSQPLQAQAEHLLSKARRHASDRDDVRYTDKAMGGLPDKEFSTLQALRNACFDAIMSRLRERGIASPSLTQSSIAWALPTSLSHAAAWKVLFEDPIIMPPEILDHLLVLQDCTPDTLAPPKNTTVYYIRTFETQNAHLQYVLHDMVDDGYHMNDRVFAWLERIHNEPPDTLITLRYVGQSINKPWERHSSDIYSTSLKTFLGRFLKTVYKWQKDALASARVQIVVNATASVPLSQDQLDLREQVLIALFGDGVLNTEAGGKDIIVFTKEDEHAFVALESDTSNLLPKHTARCSAAQLAEVKEYATYARDYAESNPESTGSANRSFTTIEKTVLAQATYAILPSTKSALMVAVASDMGEDHEDEEASFLEAGGRSADLVTTAYNRFATWEKGFGHSINPSITRNMLKANQLPIVDLFPWFKKSDEDYAFAGNLLRRYMMQAKPTIIMTYGQMPFWVVSSGFPEDLALNDFWNWEWAARKRKGSKSWSGKLGQPILCKIGKDDVVVIPNFHPGYSAHAGIVREKANRVFVLVSAIAWYAMTAALEICRDRPTWSRSRVCTEVFQQTETRTSLDHDFGKALFKAKNEYMDAIVAYNQGRIIRSHAQQLPKPHKGLLLAKTSRTRKIGNIVSTEIVGDGVGGWEVEIQKMNLSPAPKTDNDRFTLVWKEDDGARWTLKPIILSDKVFPTGKNDKRFLFFVAGGVDIRNQDGISVGVRSPIASGHCKNETLPISSILLSTVGDATSELFLRHWEAVTGLSIDSVLSTAVPGTGDSSTQDPFEEYYPSHFFLLTQSKKGLPASTKVLQQQLRKDYHDLVQQQLPASQGDMLWLLDRFLTQEYPNGGEIDMASASEHVNSVYRKIASFCGKLRYQHHPHIRTLKACAHIAEQGRTERLIASNALLTAFDLLRNTSWKAKTLALKIDGKRKDSSRYVATIDAARPKNVLQDIPDPALERSAEIISDVTDDESDDDQKPRKGKKKYVKDVDSSPPHKTGKFQDFEMSE